MLRLGCRFPCFLALSLLACLARADWPQWRGPDRTGYVPMAALTSSLPSDGLQPVWKLDPFSGGSSGGWSSPVISDGRVFLYAHTRTKKPNVTVGQAKYPWLPEEKRTGMTDEEYRQYEIKRRDEKERRSKSYRFDERLVCVDLKTGKLIWDKTNECVYTRFVQSGTPCVTNGRVYVLAPGRIARCYDASTGQVLWQQRLPGEFRDEFFASSFAVDGQTALVACGPLLALNVDDGQLLWQGDAALDYQSHSSPVVWKAGSMSVAIVNTAGGRTQAYRVADGEKLWELRTGTGQSTPVVAGNVLLTYGASRKSGLRAYRLSADSPEKEPQELWQFQRAADSGSTPVVRGDAVFVQGEKRLAKVSLADGVTVWQTTLRVSNPKYTSLIAAGDQLFYGWEGLMAFDAEGDRFELLYDAEVDSGGRLIRGDDLRKELKLDEISSDEDGLAESEKIWQREAIKSGPLPCSTPAVSGGLMVIRLRDAVACYDLRQ